MNRPPLTVRAARWSARHPWRAITGWLVLVVAALAVSAAMPVQQATDADFRVGESGRAEAMVAEAGLAGAPVETVLLTDDGGRLDPVDVAPVVRDLRAGLAGVDGVASVAAPVWSASRDAVLVAIEMAGTAEDAADHVDGVTGVVTDVRERSPGLTVEQSGGASVDAAVNERVGEDLASAELTSLPVTFAILLVAFGAVLAAGIPVLMAFGSVLLTVGLYAPLSQLVPDGGSTSNIVLLIGMAVGVDYSLLYLTREREERRRGLGTVDAVEAAARTAGHAVVVSGVAVVVAMSGLFLTRDTVFEALAVGAILVVLVSVAGSLTVLPALLAKLGRFVDRPRVPLLWRLTGRMGTGAISGRLLRPVLRRPRASALLATAVLVALAAPALGMRLQESTVESLPSDIPEVQAYLHVQDAFPSERPTLAVAATGDGAALQPALLEVAREVEDRGLVAPGESSVDLAADGRTALLQMAAPGGEGTDVNDDAVRTLREDVLPEALPGSTDWAVGGDVATALDNREHQAAALPWVVGFVLLFIMAMMGLAFRSLLLAGLTVVLNLLSVGAAFGVLQVVFGHSWADGLLDYTSPGYVVMWIPLFCFVVLVGLSMDYHVFVLSRFREELRAGRPYREAVEQSVRRTAAVVTSAAAVMVSVFAVFASLSMLEMKQLGVGLSVAILIDATIVRLVLLPAVLLLAERGLGRLGTRPGSEPVAPESEPVAVPVA